MKLHPLTHKALRLAKQNFQIIGRKQEYYITLEQLHELLEEHRKKRRETFKRT